MTARIIDGKIIASELRARVADEVARVTVHQGLSALGATSTSTVLSSPVERRDHQAKQVESFAKYI